jgi:hypothetical protein
VAQTVPAAESGSSRRGTDNAPYRSMRRRDRAVVAATGMGTSTRLDRLHRQAKRDSTPYPLPKPRSIALVFRIVDPSPTITRARARQTRQQGQAGRAAPDLGPPAGSLSVRAVPSVTAGHRGNRRPAPAALGRGRSSHRKDWTGQTVAFGAVLTWCWLAKRLARCHVEDEVFAHRLEQRESVPDRPSGHAVRDHCAL